MDFFKKNNNNGVLILTFKRGKVNALNDQVIEELNNILRELENDPGTRAIILTGQGNFFSFGFDIPEFLAYSMQKFKDYLLKFTHLYSYLFLYPKPIIAAINGHAIAGGCMLSLACDYRIMVSGKAKISLNEICFGSTVFAGITEILRFCAGSKNATEILYSGAMYTAEEAQALGLIDGIATENELIHEATKIGLEFGKKSAPAFADIKFLLRKPIVEQMQTYEKESINRFVEIWYSDTTREMVKNVKIY